MPPYSSTNLKCPRCGSKIPGQNLQRIQRHALDRVISLFQRRYRYRCRATGCGWEGTLPASHGAATAISGKERG